MTRRKYEADCFTCEERVSSVFCKLHHDGLSILNECKNVNGYKKGQNLFFEGDSVFGLYCIYKGKIKVSKIGTNGKETIVRIASASNLLGHRSLFSDSPYAASGTVIEDAEVCFISKNTIHRLIRDNPELSFQIIDRLSREMGVAEERITSMAQKNVRERFAELLLLLKETYGVKNGKKYKLDLKLTRQEMASMIGAASENLIRLVTDFKKDGLISQEGKNIYLLDIKKIESIAQLGL